MKNKILVLAGSDKIGKMCINKIDAEKFQCNCSNGLLIKYSENIPNFEKRKSITRCIY